VTQITVGGGRLWSHDADAQARPKDTMFPKNPFRILVALLGAAACGPPAVQTIQEKRTLPEPRPEQLVDASTRQRLAPMTAQQSPHGAGFGAEGGPAAAAFTWDLPEGWKELPRAQFRDANFAVTGRERLECYVTVLPGGGGGIAANLNRWRGQMGQEPLSGADIAALPRVMLLGVEAVKVQIDGTFKGAGAAGAGGGYTMIAVAAERSGAVVTAKLVGPSADVQAESPHFDALIASLRPGGNAPEQPAELGTAAFDPSSLKWKAPGGWTPGPAKPMRVVTLIPSGSAGAECWVSVLGGNGGGLAPNVARWCSQVGRATLSKEEVAALPTTDVLGRKGLLVEIEGPSAAMLAVVCELGSYSVFVRLTGSREAVRAERERFLEFVRSLS
jgi:hypothetical protein